MYVLDYHSLNIFFWRKSLPRSSNKLKSHVSLSACMYVLGRNILSQSSCSLCLYTCSGLPGSAHPHKIKYSLRSDQIHCLFPFLCKQRENISLWEGVVVLEDHYMHTNRENKSFETEYFCPIHTYEQRQQATFHWDMSRSA